MILNYIEHPSVINAVEGDTELLVSFQIPIKIVYKMGSFKIPFQYLLIVLTFFVYFTHGK